MTDQQIIQAALDAGLCFPDCWALTSPSDPTEDISDTWGSYEQRKMQTLRDFAERIKALWSDSLMTDPINPSHYRRGPVEAIDVIESAITDAPHMVPAYLQGQALKYLLRIWCKGNALEDARKCQWYLARLIAKLEG